MKTLLNYSSFRPPKRLNVGEEFSFQYKIILHHSEEQVIDEESLDVFQHTLQGLLIRFDREHMNNKQQFLHILSLNVCFENLGMYFF